MKKTSNPVSPFVMLLIPALLAVGFKSLKSENVQADKHHVNMNFDRPTLKGVIKIIF